MKLSPISIKNQEFNKSFRGYDKEEVESFLNKLADDYEELQKENESLKQELETAREKLSEFYKIEKNLQNALLKTQETSVKTIESTRKQTNLMMKEAELKAQQIIEKARVNANEIRNAVTQLKEERDLIVAKLKSIISSQAHLLEMKVEAAGKEPEAAKKIEQAKSVDVDIDDIVNKLL
jgi:cell division initiation protein